MFCRFVLYLRKLDVIEWALLAAFVLLAVSAGRC